MSPPVMEITLVKAAGPGDRERAWLQAGDTARRGPVHVIHDLAIWGMRDLQRRWVAVPPGGTFRLSWPLARDFFTGATGSPAPSR